MKLFQAPYVVKNTEGEVFVWLLTVTIEHTIHQCYCLSSWDRKKGITDSVLVHVEYVFWGVTDIRNSDIEMKLLEFFRSKQWVINLRRKDLMSYSTKKLNEQYTVCANHFEDNQFMNSAMKNRLIHNAHPIIFDIPNPPPKHHPLPSKA